MFFFFCFEFLMKFNVIRHKIEKPMKMAERKAKVQKGSGEDKETMLKCHGKV